MWMYIFRVGFNLIDILVKILFLDISSNVLLLIFWNIRDKGLVWIIYSRCWFEF